MAQHVWVQKGGYQVTSKCSDSSNEVPNVSFPFQQYEENIYLCRSGERNFIDVHVLR